MKIIIGSKTTLQEQAKRGQISIYQIICNVKLRKDADRELLKTDIRAIKGVTIVTTVPESEQETGLFVMQKFKIKFQPYGTPPSAFIKSLSDTFRKLSKRGLASFRFNADSLTKVKV